ncbi:MAG: uroporphyrinogen-III C-methyltransferase [Xanthomonadales bacterium]|nr:uroporphyrinogen-III C-methyltransferase [Xanthomonadales bacterium]
MNTDLTEIDRNSRGADAGATNGSEPRRRGGGLAALALLLALGALAGSAWLWWQDRGAAGQAQRRLADETVRLEAADSSLEQRLDRLRQELDAVRAENYGQALARVQAGVEADGARLADLASSVEEQLVVTRSLQAATDALHARLLAAETALERVASPGPDAAANLDLAEIDYLLRLASERLKLFGDVTAADQALAVADTQLAALDNPTWLGVRQDIAAARRALAQVELPDTITVASGLDALQARIPGLPFPGATPSAEVAAEPADDSWWARLKSTFGSLVTVRRASEDDTTLSLQDEDYIRQRLWLQLEMAHLALMRRDQRGFTAALARAGDTLDRWFDPATAAVQSARQALDELAVLQIRADLPDISVPWNSLRALRGGAGATDPAPADADAGQ